MKVGGMGMRINGYDFHVGLMAGKQKWTDPKVKADYEAFFALWPADVRKLLDERR